MRYTCVRRRLGLATLLGLALCLPGAAQESGMTVRGEVHGPRNRLYSDYLVRLEEVGHPTTIMRGNLAPDGSFGFRNVPPAEYQLELTTLDGTPVYQGFVTVGLQTDRIDIQLPEEQAVAAGGGTVSARQLMHPPSKRAVRSFADAVRFSSAGDYARATEALERALRESPDFAEAHVNLGVQHMRAERWSDGAAEFRRAIEIAGPSALVLSNLATAELRLGQRAEATGHARAALGMDRGSAQAHLVVGWLLAGDPRTRAEAVPHLEFAARTFPSARAILDAIRPR